MIIEETARVVALDGDQAWVTTRRRSACESCSANKGCGAGIMARSFSAGRTLQIKALNQVEAVVGEDVVLGIDDRVLVRSAVLMYLLPLLALMAGALLGEWLSEMLIHSGSEYLSVLMGLSAMIAVLWWLRGYARLLAATGDYQPRIMRRCDGVV
jgi:sigma-E factor negative regulatory protein RseC